MSEGRLARTREVYPKLATEGMSYKVGERISIRFGPIGPITPKWLTDDVRARVAEQLDPEYFYLRMMR